MVFYIWYLRSLHQAWLTWHLEDIASASGGALTVEQKGKLDLAMALVARTQVPLCCNVCMHSHCCTMELHMVLCRMPLQCKAL